MDLSKEHEEIGVYCIENILNWSINRPMWSKEEIAVVCTGDQVKNHRVGVYGVHHETK